jgi:hypothetical protein
MALPPFLNISAPTLAAFGSLVVTTLPLPPGTPKAVNPVLQTGAGANMHTIAAIANNNVANLSTLIL